MDDQGAVDAEMVSIDPHAECGERIADLEAKWKRARADFENREKEIGREREEFAKFCTVDLIRDFLPIVDAIHAAGDGLESLRKLFDAFLTQQGLEPIGRVGDRVDYLLHEVVGTRAEEGKDVGVILDVVQVGYMMHGKLLRPAKVVSAE